MMKRLTWKHLLLLVVAVAVVTQFAGYLGRSAAERVNSREASSPVRQASSEIQVVVSSQDAEGVTQDRMDMVFLKNLETYTVERVTLRAREFLASQGQPNARLGDITSEATYVETGPLRCWVAGGRRSVV